MSKQFKLTRLYAGLYTVSELSAALGYKSNACVFRWMGKGILPPPDVQFGKRYFYSKRLFNRLVIQFGRPKGDQ